MAELNETERLLYKKINLFQKRVFREFLIDAITSEDKEAFISIVRIIGKQWGVLRTVLKDETNKELEKESEKINEKKTFLNLQKSYGTINIKYCREIMRIGLKKVIPFPMKAKFVFY